MRGQQTHPEQVELMTKPVCSTKTTADQDLHRLPLRLRMNQMRTSRTRGVPPSPRRLWRLAWMFQDVTNLIRHQALIQLVKPLLQEMNLLLGEILFPHRMHLECPGGKDDHRGPGRLRISLRRGSSLAVRRRLNRFIIC